MADPLLEVDRLTVDYLTETADVRAVDHVSFTVGPGEFLGIVGESGCGKSTLLFAVAQLLSPPGEVVDGKVVFRGQDMVRLSRSELQSMRWRDYSIVMQSAMNALNPMKSIGAQFKDTLEAHGMGSSRRHPPALDRGHEPRRDRRRPPQELSPPTQRGNAPARDDRNGAPVHPAARDHGRADIGARRGRAAVADDQDQGSPAKPRVRRDLRHPRHVGREPLFGPRARDVCGPGRGGRADRRGLRAASPPVHPRSR